MIESDLYLHLKTNVTAVGSRIYPLIMPQAGVKPCLVYTVVNDRDNICLEGKPTSKEVRIQIDVYALTYSESKTIMTAVKAALYTFKSTTSGVNSHDGYVDDVTLFRQIIQFTIRN